MLQNFLRLPPAPVGYPGQAGAIQQLFPARRARRPGTSPLPGAGTGKCCRNFCGSTARSQSTWATCSSRCRARVQGVSLTQRRLGSEVSHSPFRRRVGKGNAGQFCPVVLGQASKDRQPCSPPHRLAGVVTGALAAPLGRQWKGAGNCPRSAPLARACWSSFSPFASVASCSPP